MTRLFTVPMLATLLVGMLGAIALSNSAKGESASTSDASSTDAKVLEKVRKRLMTARPDLVVSSVEKSPIAGLYQASINNGPTVYITADGAFFLTGDLFSVRETEIVNLAEEAREGDRVTLLSTLPESEMIVFSPEVKKAAVTVFTDVDCGYCQKLHREVPELNRLGIEVRYLAYPRAGVGSPSFDKLVTAWCADDKQAAMTRLKNREHVAGKSCANPVARQFRLGQKMGIQGTPAIITADGRLLPGYMPADALAQTLGLSATP
ncbi:MAG: DsbC family protein [Pseudomonadales bacterium]